MNVYYLEFQFNLLSSPDVLYFQSLEELTNFLEDSFGEIYKTIEEIQEQFIVTVMDKRESEVINGKPLLFKRKRKIIGYIKNSSMGFKFCTGKPSDVSCLSWEYQDFNRALITAEEYVNNYNRI